MHQICLHPWVYNSIKINIGRWSGYFENFHIMENNRDFFGIFSIWTILKSEKSVCKVRFYSMGLFQLINEEMVECQDFVTPIKLMDLSNYLK